METSRRQFLKLLGALAAITALPLEWRKTTIELEVAIDQDLLYDAFSIGQITKDSVEVSIDLEKMWRAVCATDQWGHEWRTSDQGNTWAWEDHWFNADGECSWT